MFLVFVLSLLFVQWFILEGKIQELCLGSNKTLKKAEGLKLLCTLIMSSEVEYPSSGIQRAENHASVSRKASTTPFPVPKADL